MENMSRNELVNNANMLEKNGIFNNPILKSAFDDAMKRTAKDKKANVLKGGIASKHVSGKAKEAMVKAREESLDSLAGLEGDWLILGDRSGSMHQCIEFARQVAAFLAQQAKGDTHLVFFDTIPEYFNCTGKSLEYIEKETEHVRDRGMTSIGCGLDYLLQKNLSVNGIAIITDGGENKAPYFDGVYKSYCSKIGIEPTIYVIRMEGAPDVLSRGLDRSGIQFTKWIHGKDFDYYSLPNLLMTMKTNRYTMYDDIMESELLTFEKVFKQTKHLI